MSIWSGTLTPDARIGAVGALRRPAHRIELAAAVVEPVARRHLAQHLLGHLARALPQLLERARLFLRRAVEIALAQRALGALHGFAGAAELARRLQAELAQAPLQPAEHVAQLPLAVAERALLVAVALPSPCWPCPAGPAGRADPAARAGPCPRWPLLALAALLSEGVVEQLLLPADEVAELVHHLAEALALALVGHAAGLQPVEQVAQLAQHLLGHVAVARARHVLQVAQHLLDVLRRHELAVAVHALHRRLAFAPAWSNCSRNCASACRSSCISFWISSSEAPSSSAFDRRSWAARKARSASVRLPSSMRSAMFHSCADDAVAGAARSLALQPPVGRPQAQDRPAGPR